MRNQVLVTVRSKELLDRLLAVQTLPIVLDTSKTIRLIFCALYKLSEPERRAEAQAIRQRRLGRRIFVVLH